jgi:hypothetical protein
MKKGILAKSNVWAKHLRPYYKRLQWGKERRAEASEIETEYDDLINGGEVIFDDQIYDLYEQDVYPPYPHI